MHWNNVRSLGNSPLSIQELKSSDMDGATVTGKNTVVSPDFLVLKFCGKAQFPHSSGRFARNYVETVPFSKIPTPGN